MSTVQIAAALATPGAPTVASSTTGGTLPASTACSYRITARSAAGTTLVSAAGTVTTGLGATNSNTVSWTAVTGAVSYDVYGRTAGGELFIANTASLSYVDTGAITPNGAQPTQTSAALAAPQYSADIAVTATAPVNVGLYEANGQLISEMVNPARIQRKGPNGFYFDTGLSLAFPTPNVCLRDPGTYRVAYEGISGPASGLCIGVLSDP